MFHYTVFFRWNKILISIVFVVLGAIRDLVKTNCSKNYKGLFQPLSASSAVQAKVCIHAGKAIRRPCWEMQQQQQQSQNMTALLIQQQQHFMNIMKSLLKKPQ